MKRVIEPPPGDLSTCPYCGHKTSICDMSAVYGSRFKGAGQLLLCSGFPECDSFVGVHDKSDIPKGTIANAQLRDARKQAHFEFDTLWRGSADRKRICTQRSDAYRLLASLLKVPVGQAHIGWCDLNQCHAIMAYVTHLYATMKGTT